MFGRQIFLAPMDGTRIQTRRDALLRDIAVNQRRGVPCTELASIPSLRNDGLMLALNFILIENDDRIQPNNIYLRTNRGNTPNQHMLHYIRQMEERYIAMERELTRAKMLIPRVTRNTNPVHHTVQTDVKWKERAHAKYGYLFGTSTGNRYRRNRAQMNVSSRRKYIIKRGKDFSQGLQNDIYPIKEPCDYACQSMMLNDESSTVPPLHSASIILPQDTKESSDLSEQKETNFKEDNDVQETVDKCGAVEDIFGNPRKHDDTFETQRFATSITDDDEKMSMEVCQRFGKKREPETSYHTGFDVECKCRAQTKSGMGTPEFQSIIRPKFDKDTFDRKPQVEQPTYHRHEPNTNSDKKCLSKQPKIFENTDIRQNVSLPSQQFQSKRNYYNNNHSKNLACERTRCRNDSNHYSRMFERQKKDAHRRGPTPRSTVHTAYTPMPQSSSWNSVLDPNVFTIQLLRLAVLLYAPTLMPALNLLIARQTAQTSIPVPCSEGSNDLLSQIFTILSNQQNVPNLRYAQDSGTGGETLQSQRESKWQNSSSHRHSSPQKISKQLRNAKTSVFQKAVVNRQLEKNSIAVNTSLELCNCNNMKQSSTSTTYDQIEESEKLVYVWTDHKSELSETMMHCHQEQGKVFAKKDEKECSLINEEPDLWQRAPIEDLWDI